MMLYRILRRAARTALGWYYADVTVQGREHVPLIGPVLLVANHPNALVDAMAVAVSVPRRVLLTAKATLFQQPILAAALRTVGVVPLRRAKDEPAATTTSSDEAPLAVPPAVRNAVAFQAVTTALAHGGAVLVFPEGISHDAPALAPLRTGAARMTLMAHDAGVVTLRVVPVGLVYEEKERPRSRLLVNIGEPLEVHAWLAANDADAGALTAEIDAHLRRATLNFATEARARRVVQLARMLDALTRDAPPLGHPRPLAPEADLARRVEAAHDVLAAAPDAAVRRADEFIASMDAFERSLARRGVTLSELHVSPRVRHGARFVIRESLLLAVALPVAFVDRFAHDVPVRLARALARRSLAVDPSRDQPAMRTILLAAALLPLWYLALGAVLAHWLGWAIALLALLVMTLSASAELALRDRVARAYRRAHTYLALRADPPFRKGALAEADQLLSEAQAIERELLASGVHASTAPHQGVRRGGGR